MYGCVRLNHFSWAEPDISGKPVITPSIAPRPQLAGPIFPSDHPTESVTYKDQTGCITMFCLFTLFFFLSFFLSFFLLFEVLRPFQGYFSSYETGQSVGGTKTGEHWRICKQNGLSHMWPVRGSNLHQTQR